MALNLVLMAQNDGQEVPMFNENGEVLLHDVQNNAYHYAPLSEEMMRSYPQLLALNEPMELSNDYNDPKQKAYWTYEATIMLINKYKAYQRMFADSIHKNTEVWDKISNEFRSDGFSFCGVQCENRWKYIRAKYIKKKDNTGPGSTGDELYQFEYFKEMDEVLGKKPNIIPKHLASSEHKQHKQTPSKAQVSKSTTQPTSSNYQSNTSPSTYRSNSFDPGNSSVDLTSNDNATLTNSRKSLETTESSLRSQRSLDTRHLHSLFGDDGTDHQSDDDNETAEAAAKSTKKGKPRKEPWEDNIQRQERYHNEMMELQRDSLNTFKDFMSKIIDCFQQN